MGRSREPIDLRRQPAQSLFPWYRLLEQLPAPPLNFEELFPVSQPVELEVGSGRGLFLMNAAMLQPHINFLGIECDLKEARRAARRVQKRNLQNARMIGGDARRLIAHYLPTGCLSAVHVYFPDPWWKRRHRKRRIFCPTFVAEVARLLRPGGSLHSWTDVEEYFGQIRKLVNQSPVLAEQPPPDEKAPRHDMDYHTSFERKKRQAGLPIYRAQWLRNDQPAPPPAVPFDLPLKPEWQPHAQPFDSAGMDLDDPDLDDDELEDDDIDADDQDRDD